MRQHFLSLVQQLRGRRRLFDYRVHTHASYSYCDEVRHPRHGSRRRAETAGSESPFIPSRARVHAA